MTKIPLTIRAGGAFIAIALVTVIYMIIELINSGLAEPFGVTWRFIGIVAAAALLGAFATMRRDQENTRSQIVALIVALLLIVGTRFLPADPFYFVEQYWLAFWAVGAFLCALILRRSSMPK